MRACSWNISFISFEIISILFRGCETLGFFSWGFDLFGSIDVAIDVAIERLNANKGTKEKIQAIYAQMGTDKVFGRTDIAAITNDSVTSAGKLINKLKEAGLIEAVSGHGKGKYRFVAPKE